MIRTRKITASVLFVVMIIALVIIFSGCFGQNGEISEKVKDVPLSVNIEKEVYPPNTLGVCINFTNIGKEDVELGQFLFYIYKYDPTLKAYQEDFPFFIPLTLGPTASYKVSYWSTGVYYFHPLPAEKIDRYKFIIKKIDEDEIERDLEKIKDSKKLEEYEYEPKTIFSIEFSVTPEDWNNPEFIVGESQEIKESPAVEETTDPYEEIKRVLG